MCTYDAGNVDQKQSSAITGEIIRLGIGQFPYRVIWSLRECMGATVERKQPRSVAGKGHGKRVAASK